MFAFLEEIFIGILGSIALLLAYKSDRLYRIRKFITKLITGKCELYRIALNQRSASERTIAIETSILRSSSQEIRDGLYSLPIGRYVDMIMKFKKIPDDSRFVKSFTLAIEQLRGYCDLRAEAEKLRAINFDSEDCQNSIILTKLWNIFIEDEPFSMKSKKWSYIGFQGQCPSTDFRGMGTLSALNLCHFVEFYTEISKSVFSSSLHPTRGYPFAIVGINLTDVLIGFLRRGCLKRHFYNRFNTAPTLNDLHYVYACLFCRFHLFWIESTRDIMQFNKYRKLFESNLESEMSNEHFHFELSSVE